MNRLILWIFTIFSVGTIASCKKNDSASIVGNWNLVSDSTRFVGVDTVNSYHSYYIGQPSDYYDFNKNGNLYVKEGSHLDTMAYQVLPGNQVGCVAAPGDEESYTTSNITATSATFNILYNSPEGTLTKIIYLIR